MKKFLLFLIVTLAIVSLAGAFLFASSKEKGETGSPEAAKGDIFAEPNELVFWWYGEEDAPGLSKYIDALCEAYTKHHPNITIARSHHSAAELVSDFMAATEVQSGPDIATLWGGVTQFEQVWLGNIAPISDYVSAEEMSHWTGRDYDSYDGKVWSCDMAGNMFVMIYYKDHFRDAGLDPEKPPVTWDEFLADCKKLKDAGHDPFCLGFKGWGGDAWSFLFVYQAMTSQDLKEIIVGKQSWTDPDAMWSFTKAKELKDKGYFIPAAASLELGESWQEWRSGKATFTYLPAMSAITWTDELGKDKVGIMNIPTLTDKPIDYQVLMPYSYFITNWSPHKEIAADFLTFWHTQEAMNLMIDTLNASFIPPDDRLDMSRIKDPLKRQLAESMDAGFKRGTWMTSSLMPFAVMDEGFLPAVQLVVAGDLTPMQAAQKTEDATERWRTLNPEALEKFKIWAGIK
jgi:ABC-type glycerol-3-phosphate transport system substrate-binding protein